MCIDASALIALLLREPGHDKVSEAIAADAGVCTANLAEVVAVLVRGGMPFDRARAVTLGLPVTFVDLDPELAVRAGAMIGETRGLGLSHGDRCCLALAAREKVPAITADAAWLQAGPLVGVSVELIR